MPKTALVTGASRGIGAACAQALAQAGYAVIACYHTGQKEAESVCEKILQAGGECAVYGMDVADSAQAQAAAKFAIARYGRIDLLVNSAGIAHFSLASETTDQEWRRVFSVNMDGVFYMCRAVMPDMIARKSGCILNIGSMWGEVGASCESAYSASKAAVIGYTRALAKELGPSGIRVNCISPGLIDTEMNRMLSSADKAAVVEETPLGRMGTPQDVAQLAVFLAQDRFITGQVIGVNGGLVI